MVEILASLKRLLGGGEAQPSSKKPMARIVVMPATMPGRFEALVPVVAKEAITTALKNAGIDYNCGLSTALEWDEEEYSIQFAEAAADAVQRICDAFGDLVPSWYQAATSWRRCGLPLQKVTGAYRYECAGKHTFRPKAVGWVDYLEELGHTGVRRHRWPGDTCPHRIAVDPDSQR